MCLTIIKVPSNPQLLEQCWKSVWKKENGKYYSPIMMLQINDTGWLLPRKINKRKTFRKCASLGSGFIHAYHNNKVGICGKITMAYAFNVKAYGEYDLVCMALYIPECDKTNKNVATTNKIKRLLKQKTMSVQGIVRAFPHLKECYR